MLRDFPIAVHPDFSVVYEDEDALVVDKAAPLIMHPTGCVRRYEPTLLGGVSQLLAYELACGGCVSLINRLDRETSGLVLIAKNAATARELGCAMQRHLIRKRYLAIVRGWPLWDSACCAEPLAPMHTFAPTRIRVRQACHPAGRPCRTLFRVMKCIPARDELPELALMECLPITGRMHQIRAHLSFLGFPILGDKIYGPDESCYLDFIRDGWTPQLAARLLLPRHALHACDLKFPLHGQIIRVHTELPPDLAAFLHDNSTHDPSQL